ncbi:hypothetical protein C8J56DRAFT_597431 [Mycena floridula]|nr:hypothetical protein C8J56DRAFT_597431 [Mycena floridula]
MKHGKLDEARTNFKEAFATYQNLEGVLALAEESVNNYEQEKVSCSFYVDKLDDSSRIPTAEEAAALTYTWHKEDIEWREHEDSIELQPDDGEQEIPDDISKPEDNDDDDRLRDDDEEELPSSDENHGASQTQDEALERIEGEVDHPLADHDEPAAAMGRPRKWHVISQLNLRHPNAQPKRKDCVKDVALLADIFHNFKDCLWCYRLG